MPKHDAVVSTVVRVEPPTAEAPREARAFSVQLEGGRIVRLDAADERAEGRARVLEGLRVRRLPVYLEVDPATSAITRMLIPHVSRVVAIRPIDKGVLGVDLDRSHGRHVLRGGTEDFESLERQLREAMRTRAPVIITEDEEHEILDVRAYTPGPEGPLPPFPRPELPRPLRWPFDWLREWFDHIWYWPWWPWWWFGCISGNKAQQVFDALAATSCDPLTVPPPCIPFLYPDDGCWARAHEMCRLMQNMGLKPRKVWIQGSLYVSTKNNPSCGVWWGWHVAPTLCVRTRSFWFTQRMVMDPSLFATPVSQATWKGVQGDPNASLTDSAASIYYLWGMVTDPSYTETNYYLDFYRLQLQNRAITYGPPPYAACP